MKKTYAGQLSQADWGEAYDILFISTVKIPLIEELQWMVGETVTVRYWITDEEVTREQAQEDFLSVCMGASDGQFGSRYSEATGYLWTDEDLNVGGHDLSGELRCYAGKWLILEVEVDGK